MTLGWAYDANGNRVAQTGTVAGTYTISPASNRLNATTGSPVRSYSHDGAGNTLSFGGTTFAYNNRGRLATATRGGLTTSYGYNALGQRISKSSGAGTTLFVYDESGHLLGEYTAGGALVQETVWLGEVPVATLRPGAGGVSMYQVHADHLGVPRSITRPADHAIVWRWDGDPFGTAPAEENPGGLGTFRYDLRFPGQYRDAETGDHRSVAAGIQYRAHPQLARRHHPGRIRRGISPAGNRGSIFNRGLQSESVLNRGAGQADLLSACRTVSRSISSGCGGLCILVIQTGLGDGPGSPRLRRLHQ